MRSLVRVSAPLVFAAAALIAVAVGCKDSNSITGNNSSAPTPTLSAPTPTPQSGIAGSWTGDFVRFDMEGTCKPTPATAHFTVSGASVTGTLSTETAYCGMGKMVFQGSLQGNSLSGTVTGLLVTGTANGTLSGTTLGVTLRHSRLPLSGSLRLHR